MAALISVHSVFIHVHTGYGQEDNDQGTGVIQLIRHSFIAKNVCVCVHVCERASVQECMRTCVGVYVCVCMRTCVGVDVCLYACVCVWLSTCKSTCRS